MKRVLVVIVALGCFCLCSNAQSRTSLIQRINEIKTQSDVYFWDQFTHPDADTAKVNAVKRLLIDVNNMNDASSQKLTVEELLPHASFINMDRGNLKQYFAYIKKSDAKKLWSRHSDVTISVNKDVSSSSVVDTTEEPQAFSQQKAFVPDAFVVRVMETRNFLNVYKLLKALQSQGQIFQFGKLKDVSDYNSLNLILFDIHSQEIVTMLSPVISGGQRTNLVTGAEDSLSNYPAEMTAVIWYIKK